MNPENRFDKRLKVIPAEIWSKVTQIEELKGQWTGGVKLNPQVLGRLKKSVLVTSTGASTRIEGAHLTDEDVEKLMRGLTMQKFADRDKQEARRNFNKSKGCSAHRQPSAGQTSKAEKNREDRLGKNDKI